ncbi:hypothetical protein QJ850_gp261 [Acanthamoeba polyphaga mimivirus]|uniref:Uncharacterized protein n=1 Tax=Acanthamoeba polyphaga mimivirus Kroon TaxID=3069720 RepID=A0A0G2Y3R7_9VIRU|nr:hypothetical protein QJ850_gp261 [Acanthamoeba polyphaga mimivirus]AKI80438.1 hypothetical protein [Acanthamoeba polyphaga mimivirus Kroon]
MNIPGIYYDSMCQELSVKNITRWNTGDNTVSSNSNEIRSHASIAYFKWIEDGIDTLDPLYNPIVKVFRKYHGDLTDRLTSIIESSIWLCNFHGIINPIDVIKLCGSVKSTTSVSFQKYIETNRRLRSILVDILFSSVYMTSEGIKNIFNEIDKLIETLSHTKSQYKFKSCNCNQQISKKRNFIEIYTTPSFLEPKIIVQPPDVKFPLSFPTKKPRFYQEQSVQQPTIKQPIIKELTTRIPSVPEILHAVRELDLNYTESSCSEC